MKYILALDQGTTSSRSILVDVTGNITAIEQQEFKQIFPRSGWVEHDPNEIWLTQLSTMRKVMQRTGATLDQLDSIGITNQRETTIVWNRETGEPLYNAIVWQDRRTSAYCDELKSRGLAEVVRAKTGLVIDAYFSATKIRWILENIDGARKMAAAGKLAFGTVDSWLIYNLTAGRVHTTDYSNASRTMLYNIHTLTWDNDLLELLDIPESMLPSVKPSSGFFGETDTSIARISVPIMGVAGDQQAALFGQQCVTPGMAKNTYGTGCFMLMHTGEQPVASDSGLLTTIAWGLDGQVEYALEGSVFVAGAAIQWLRDGLRIIDTAPETQRMAESLDDNGDVYFVPALSGLGTPYWDMQARGMIIGLTRGTTREHIARAALEAIAFQSLEVLDVMRKDGQIDLRELRVDGGASVNDFLMQFQADVLQVPVRRPVLTESTALGAAYLAGLGSGLWSHASLKDIWKIDQTFEPNINPADRDGMYARWKLAVQRSLQWAT